MKKWAWFKREEPQQGNLFSPKPAPQQSRPAPPPARPSAPPPPPAAPSLPPTTPATPPRSPELAGQPPGAGRVELSLLYPPTTQPGAVRLPPAPAPKPERVIFTVGELTRDIKATLERGYARVWVRGEVSGFRGPNARGHLYFSLKDADACLDAKMWASAAQRLKFSLRDGLSVIAEGSIDLYEPQGRYSLIVQRIEPEGEGALALAFQQLKERLAAEGLLGDNRKRPPRTIPFLPRRIGVVTSLHGAAIRDFLRVLHRRHPRLSVLVCDARVQGDGSALEVVRAMRRLSRTDVDVIVLTRGGGSNEDLWTFNEELVARAIAACPIPIVSAIGHEVEFTIADFVADLRAPTPSAAAERLAPVLADLDLSLRNIAGRLRKSVERQVLADRQRLHRLAARLADPRRVLGQKRLHLSEETDRMVRAVRAAAAFHRGRMVAAEDRLLRQRPQARLARNRQELNRMSDRLRGCIWEELRRRRRELAEGRLAIERASPARAVHDAHRRLLSFSARLSELGRKQALGEQGRFRTLEARLEAMSPLKVMARGYAVVFRSRDQRVVRSASQVEVGEALAIKVAGAGCQAPEDCERIDATVTGTRSKPPS